MQIVHSQLSGRTRLEVPTGDSGFATVCNMNSNIGYHSIDTSGKTVISMLNIQNLYGSVQLIKQFKRARKEAVCRLYHY